MLNPLHVFVSRSIHALHKLALAKQLLHHEESSRDVEAALVGAALEALTDAVVLSQVAEPFTMLLRRQPGGV